MLFWVTVEVADAGFGQGGPRIFVEILSGKQIEQYNIGQGPGPTLKPWKLLHF